MRHPIVISGPVAWNQIVYLDHLPEPRPHMQFAQESYETIGATSAAKALNLAALGHDVTVRTVLGSDGTADRLRTLLSAAGVAVHAAVVQGESERHLNLMTDEGERVSLYLSSPAERTVDTAAFAALIQDAAAIVMDLSLSSRELLQTAVASGIPLWTDIHDYDGTSEFHAPFIAAASYVFMNADGMAEPEPFMQSCVEAGASAVVCTLGERGAIAYDAEGLHRVDAVPTEVRDSNGAGDAFFSGFLHASLGGASMAEALADAAAQAAVALRSRHLHPVLDDVLGMSTTGRHTDTHKP